MKALRRCLILVHTLVRILLFINSLVVSVFMIGFKHELIGHSINDKLASIDGGMYAGVRDTIDRTATVTDGTKFVRITTSSRYIAFLV